MGALLCAETFMLLLIVSGVRSDGEMHTVTAERMQTTKFLDDQVEAALACVKEEQVWRGRMVTMLTCDNVASFNNWAAQQVNEVEGQAMAVQLSHVNGNFTLPPNANLSLVMLSLHQTNLTHFTNHTQDLSTLEELVVSGNPDFDASSLLQLGELPSLVMLQMASVPLATLSNRKLKQVLKEMPALQYLDVSSSNLHHLEVNTFHQNTKLQKLNISKNEFINLSLDEGLIQQLVHLNISDCSMEQLQVQSRPGETIQTNLSVVDLSYNYLTSLPVSFMNIISDSLVHLNISGNLWNKSCTLCSHYHLWEYATNHPDRVYRDQDTLSCFRQEEALKTCGWEECPPTCTCDPKSKTVNCSSTDLKTVPRLAPSDAEILIIKNNSLLNMSGIESPVWCKVKTVIADHNRISSIIPPNTVGHCSCFDHDDWYEEDENCLPQSLKKLSLSHNKIKNLSHSDCQLLYSLRELHLSHNKVEHLGSYVCSSLERLEVLYMNNNVFSDLEGQDVAPYPNLRKLNLSFNKLVTLPYRTIELMPKLRVLDVSNNKLREFSGETSTPDTPFTFMVPNFLEVLDLSNNNLELINSVLSLEHIPILKQLSIYNNPWECSCEIITVLVARVLEDLKNTSMVNAVRTLECQMPSNLRGMQMNDSRVLQICLKTETPSDFFSVMVGILIIIGLVALVFHISCQKITTNICDVQRLPPASRDATHRRMYSVFIVHSWQDNEMVKADLVDPLTNLGYSVLWSENAYPPGDNLEASIERAVTKSRRMLVIASNNLISFPNAKRIILKGLNEERRIPGFKVVALVMDDLPRTLYPVLYEVVVRRTHVSRQNSNYIRAICDVLPMPGPSQRIITFTETDLYCFLWQQWEVIKRRENQRAHLQELFPSQNSDPHGSSASPSSALQNENGVAMSSISDDIWKAVLLRSQGKPTPVSTIEQPHSLSNHYTLEINSEDEEVVQIEGFSRVNSERHSTKF